MLGGNYKKICSETNLNGLLLPFGKANRREIMVISNPTMEQGCLYIDGINCENVQRLHNFNVGELYPYFCYTDYTGYVLICNLKSD